MILQNASLPMQLYHDTSLSSVVHDTQTPANDLNQDLEIINNWAYQWKMNFNADPTKQVSYSRSNF